MGRSIRNSRGIRAALTSGALAVALTAGALAGAADAADPVFPIQLVTVDTPTRADKVRLQSLNLDLTEHAGHDYVEVVLHSTLDAAALSGAGFTWDVRIADLVRREAEINTANRLYAGKTLVSPLTSGRDTYRTLADYNREMAELAAAHPALVKHLTLARPSLEGKPVQGIEIGSNVKAAEDGRPVFLMLGLHHAREWPSGEHAMEFAYDLIKGYGKNGKITDLLKRARVIVVPVVNVDGFEKSINDGQLVDLREVDGGGTAAILGTPGNAYKRKNCRMPAGADPLTPACTLTTSPGGFGVGVDLNRNYGGLWGGPGASETYADPTYRGSGPFSEPETQNIRELISSRQVTTMVTNHTFSNLVLRPNGVSPEQTGPDGHPVGEAHDEEGLKALGARMTDQNGYRNIHGWELYDTTGTTEDWSYNVTGGFGYTFEIGPDEFHPPFPEVIDEYLGAGPYQGKGNRAAFLIALENTVNTATHSVITGKAPAGAVLRLRKDTVTPTWNQEETLGEKLDTSMTVGPDGSYTWHVNPSTRPIVMERRYQALAEEPIRSETFEGGPTAPTQETDHEFTVTESGVDLLKVDLDWPADDDMDLEVYRKNADGSLEEVGSSGNFVGEKEQVLLQSPTPGTYVLRVINFASVSPSYTLTAGLYDTTTQTVPRTLVEAWTLSCEKNGKILQQVPVVVDRGQRVKVDLRSCAS